jgi:hypothetical protein
VLAGYGAVAGPSGGAVSQPYPPYPTTSGTLGAQAYAGSPWAYPRYPQYPAPTAYGETAYSMPHHVAVPGAPYLPPTHAGVVQPSGVPGTSTPVVLPYTANPTWPYPGHYGYGAYQGPVGASGYPRTNSHDEQPTVHALSGPGRPAPEPAKPAGGYRVQWQPPYTGPRAEPSPPVPASMLAPPFAPTASHTHEAQVSNASTPNHMPQIDPILLNASSVP